MKLQTSNLVNHHLDMLKQLKEVHYLLLEKVPTSKAAKIIQSNSAMSLQKSSYFPLCWK